jgi:hypothetical protein
MRISRSHLVACAVACLAATTSDASPRNWSLLPEVPHSGDDLTSSRYQVLVSGLRLGQYRIVFEQTRWSDLRRNLGPLKMRRQEDELEAKDWTCFTVVTDLGRFQIWPDTDKLQGGHITEVIAQAGAPWPLAECPIVNPGPGVAALDNGVWIGTTRSELLKRLGQPTAVHGATLIYDSARVDPKLGHGTAFERLIFEMRDGRVDRLLAEKNATDGP